MHRRLAGSVIAAALVLGTTIPGQADDAATVPTYRGDAGRTGRMPDPAPHRAWKRLAGGGSVLRSPPTTTRVAT